MVVKPAITHIINFLTKDFEAGIRKNKETKKMFCFGLTGWLGSRGYRTCWLKSGGIGDSGHGGEEGKVEGLVSWVYYIFVEDWKFWPNLGRSRNIHYN